MKIARSICLTLVLLANGPGAALAQRQDYPAPPRDAKNASFWRRFDYPPPSPIFPPLEWYGPLTTVKGRPGPFLPVARQDKAVFSKRTVEQAVSYADLTAGDALLVAHDGVLQVEHYKATKNVGGHAYGAGHRFSTHSMARGMGAIAIGVLIDRGIIKAIDSPAAAYIHEWRNDARSAITIRQLLDMSSGLKSEFSADPGSVYMQVYYGSDVEQVMARAPLANPPGTSFAFDPHNNQAIGLIIERASGLRYEAFVSKYIWQKLGAADAQMQLDRPGGRAMAYCCTLTTPRDWLRLGEMLRNEGVWRGRRIVSAQWVRMMRTPSAVNPGFGLQLLLGGAWTRSDLNTRLDKQKGTLDAIRSPQAFYLSGAGDINMMVIPDQKLTILRTGYPSPDYRFHVVPNLLIDDLTKTRAAGAWDTLYAYRFTLPPATAPTLDGSGLRYWPMQRVTSGAGGRALPRKATVCETGAAFAAIDERLAKASNYGLIVYQDGAVRHERYAGTFSAVTRGESASMHKSVMGILVGAAIGDGKIKNVEQPISTWLPEWAGDPRGAITLKNLLQMSSGLTPVPFDMAVGSSYSQLINGADLERTVLSLVRKEAPGIGFEYSGHVSQLVGLILERATGVPYADYLQDRLWAPLGASDAYVVQDRPRGLVKTYATLLAVPEDWARIGALLLNDGNVRGVQVVPPSWIAEMTAPSTANANYGYQLWRASPYQPRRYYSQSNPIYTVKAAEPFLAPDTVYFDGATGRRVYISKAEKSVIVRLGDADPDWDDSWLPNAVFKAMRSCR